MLSTSKLINKNFTDTTALVRLGYFTLVLIRDHRGAA